MPDLNTEIANVVPAWKLARDRAQRTIAGITARGPRRVSVGDHPHAEEIRDAAAAEYRAELAPHREKLAIYDYALSAAEQGLVPHFSGRTSAGHDFNVQHAELLTVAAALGRAVYPRSSDLEPPQ